MIELITISRFLTDYFWEYKLLSILHAAGSLAIPVALLIHFKMIPLKICQTDKIFFTFSFLTIVSFVVSFNNESIVDFLKFITYFFFYFIGRLIPVKLANGKTLGVFALLALSFLSVLAFTGNGYKSWGGVNTFTGGYFFKTDLAIASLIFLAAVFANLQNKIVLFAAISGAAYLVFKSNARIALPLVLIIPLFITISLRQKFIKINVKTIAVGLIVSALSMSLFFLIDFKALGMLGFDFSDPYSAANTQGRSVIWHAVFQAYSNSDLIGKLFGLGFDADSRATHLFSESIQLEGVRAHSSYLYLLICMGIFGSFVFYYLLYSIFSKIPFLLRYGNRDAIKIAVLSATFFILFAWLSLTTEIVIRPQLMVLLFFFSGLHVQLYLNLKNKDITNVRA